MLHNVNKSNNKVYIFLNQLSYLKVSGDELWCRKKKCWMSLILKKKRERGKDKFDLF